MAERFSFHYLHFNQNRNSDMLKKILLLAAISLPIFAQSPLQVTGTDHQIIYWAFNHQFAQAEKLVEEKITENPNIPKYYFMKILTQSLKHLADSDQFNFEKRFDYRRQKNDELIEYTEKVIERFDDIEMTPENQYYLANIYGYLGRMYGLQKSFMSAFSNAKEGKDLLEELIEKYPEIYDAYLLLGMFEYYADRLGGVTEFIAGILGFSGDRTQGLEYLKLAQQKGQLTKPMAEFILGETYFTQEGNPFDALWYFNILVKKYPSNKDFYDWCTRILLQLDRLTEAEAMINNDTKNFTTGFTKGYFYVKNGEYKKAADLLNELIEKKDFKWRGAYNNAKLMRAISALFVGKVFPNLQNELDEEQLVIYNEIKASLTLAKEVFNFATTVGRLGVGMQIEIPQIENLPRGGYLESMYKFYAGVYYERYRDGTNAIKFLTQVAKGKNYFNREAIEYLIHIYKSYKPTEQQLDELENLIDELDDDDLEFSFMDLKK